MSIAKLTAADAWSKRRIKGGFRFNPMAKGRSTALLPLQKAQVIGLLIGRAEARSIIMQRR